jgi:hypothetical protein
MASHMTNRRAVAGRGPSLWSSSAKEPEARGAPPRGSRTTWGSQMASGGANEAARPIFVKDVDANLRDGATHDIDVLPDATNS